MVGSDPALARWRSLVEERLRMALPADAGVLGEAMAYALLGAGKRLRPLIVLAAGAAVGPSPEPAGLVLQAAVAIECVHAYSLVHDDLPAMDDDDLRRGRPTVHRAFDEATAILAGDALQALAFGVLADPGHGDEPGRVVALVRELAEAAGALGMVGGQQLDLCAGTDASAEVVRHMHRLKTGALFCAAARMGGLAAGGDPLALARLSAFGEAFGTMYQALDDLADAGDDAARPSLVRALGAGAVRVAAMAAAAEARQQAGSLGAGGRLLSALVDEVAGPSEAGAAGG